MMDGVYRYYAFISYSHKDAKWAKWIQDAVEHYKLPAIIRRETKEPLPKKLSPVFRDATHLGAGKLVNNLHSELEASKFLIVVCSPSAANPNAEGKHFVDSEVRHFCELGRADRIIPVIVEGTPDTSFCPKIKEEEILALDATKFPKERILNDIVARLLGLRPDDLWRRELRRRRRQLIVRGCATLFAGLVMALGGWYWHDWNTEKVAYFKDYVDCFGIPRGVFQLGKDAIKGRGQSYRFHYQGYDRFLPWHRKSVLRKMFCVNSFDREVVEKYDLPLHPKTAGMAFRYDEDGNLQEIRHLAPNGHETAIFRFVGTKRQFVDVTRRGHDGRWGTVERDDLPKGTSLKKLHRYLVERNEDGFVRKVTYHMNAKGSLANVGGISGKSFEADAMGRITSVKTFAWDGSPVTGVDADGDEFRYAYSGDGGIADFSIFKNGKKVISVRNTFDRNGNAVSERRYDSAGDPLSKGWFEERREYDASGQWVKIARLDKSGMPIKSPRSIIERKVEYENGRLAFADERYFTEDGKAGRDGDEGLARRAIRYDANGMTIEMKGYRSDGSLVLPVIRRCYDKAMQEIETGNFDGAGKPCETNGWAFWVTERLYVPQDDTVQIVERHLDAERRPVCAGANNTASEVVSIDGNGRVVEIACFGVRGERIIGAKRWHSKRFKYDRLGYHAEVAFFGIEGEAVRACVENIEPSDRVHAVKSVCDEAGNVLEASVWDVDGTPMNIPSRGYSKEVRRYDGAGRQIEWAFFDANGNRVVPRGKGCKYCRGTTRYADDTGGKEERHVHIDGSYLKTVVDANGNCLRESYHNPDDSLRQDENGVAQVLMKYDGKNRLIKKGFFDVHGNRTLTIEGIAGWENVYDERDDHVEERHFGLDGKTCSDTTGIAIVRWHYDEAHHKVAKDLFDAVGNPAPNTDGDYGERWEYDEHGNQTASYSIGKNGKVKLDANGVGIVRYKYDARGRRIWRRFFDADGKPVKSKEGIGGWSSEYDAAGNETCRMFFDEKENPCMCDGRAGWRVRHDDLGREIERVHLDRDGSVMAQYLKINGVEMKFGKVTISYGRDGRMTRSCEGAGGEEIMEHVKRLRAVYTRDGDLERLELTDEDGNRVNCSLGYARKEMKYNEFREITEESWWDAAGNPVLFKPEGVHRTVVEYKRSATGLVLDVRNYDTDGYPTMGKTSGFFRALKKFDASGRLLSMEFFDEKKKPVAAANGIATLTVAYDSRGRFVRARRNDGTATFEMAIKYPERKGGMIDIELRDADGRVVEERHLTLEDAEPILRTGRYRYTVDAASRFPTEMLVNE